MRSLKMQTLMDRSAIILSIACAIHCFFLPVIVVMLPALANTFLGNESFHRLLLWFVVPTSALALTQGCRRQKDQIVLTSILSGLALLTGTVIVGHSVVGEQGERIGTVLGAMILAFGHIRNYKLCCQNKSKI